MGERLGSAVLEFGVEANATQELATRASDAVEEESNRSCDRGVDTVLDRGELQSGGTSAGGSTRKASEARTTVTRTAAAQMMASMGEIFQKL